MDRCDFTDLGLLQQTEHCYGIWNQYNTIFTSIRQINLSNESYTNLNIIQSMARMTYILRLQRLKSFFFNTTKIVKKNDIQAVISRETSIWGKGGNHCTLITMVNALEKTRRPIHSEAILKAKGNFTIPWPFEFELKIDSLSLKINPYTNKYTPIFTKFSKITGPPLRLKTN